MRIDELEMITPTEGNSGDLEALLGAALHSPGMGTWMSMLGLDNFREVRKRGEVVAGLGYVPMGQWFGGQSVPCIGITAVGVAPEQRGTGVGGAMLKMMLADMREMGVPLSCLYPATLPFYQKIGFERAGQRVIYELPIDAIDVSERGLDLVPVGPDDYPTLHALYERRARLSSGNLDRAQWMWDRKLDSADQQTFRYLIMKDGEPEGYIAYRQGERSTPLAVTDVCVLTQAAARRVLTLFAAYRSMLEFATWAGAPLDPLAFALIEPQVAVAHPRVTTKSVFEWMLRIVDVKGALEARGYPEGLIAELHFDISDEHVEANNGRFVLEVGDGRGTVRPGGEGRIRLHVRDLAAIYSGFVTPGDLPTLGTGTACIAEGDLALTGAVFSAARPWLSDMF
jgi:predicted acetyltransferase